MRPLLNNEHDSADLPRKILYECHENTLTILGNKTERFTFDHVGAQTCEQVSYIHDPSERQMDVRKCCFKKSANRSQMHAWKGITGLFLRSKCAEHLSNIHCHFLSECISGQTGSGKTFTMLGPSDFDSDLQTRGLIPRCLDYLFGRIQDEDKRVR